MKRTTCRGCGSDRLALAYDFGLQPLAGFYPVVPESTQSAARYSLDLSQCCECGLLQVTNLPPIDDVFHEDYRYSSSTVPGLVRHFEQYADYLAARLPDGARVLEFGCNDGVLLSRLRERGFTVTGVDASDNVAQLARDKGLDVRTGFFTAEFVRENGLSGRFDAITCSNVFAHIDDLHRSMAAVRGALRKAGEFFVEVHDAEMLLRGAQFDTIYHEHLTYFGADTLAGLVVREGFKPVSSDATPMHGGGLRFHCRKTDLRPGIEPPVGATTDGAVFGNAIKRCRSQIGELASQYGALHAYGAAGRSQMFINMTGTADRFAVVYDDSPFRQNRFIVGTDIPIAPYEGQEGGCCVILAWNYADAIAAKLADRFDNVVVLFPELRDVTHRQPATNAR